jgi:hypothetical protein
MENGASAKKVETLLSTADQLSKEAAQLEQQACDMMAPKMCRDAAKAIASRNNRVAVFLGAGASKTFGWPLTHELLPAIVEGLIIGDLFEDERINSPKRNKQDRDLLRETLEAFCPGIRFDKEYLAANRNGLPLITSLLSLLDHAIATNQCVVSRKTSEELRHCRTLMERAIYEVIEHVLVPVSPGYYPSRKPNAETRALVGWLDGIRADHSQVGIISSNYDLAIEGAWGLDSMNSRTAESQRVDFGFPWIWASNASETLIPQPQDPIRRIYKLHGSTNWTRCGLCDRVYVNPGVDIAVYAYEREAIDNNSCHCGHSKLEVQIVSPSFIRDVRAPNLIRVWQASLDWLRAADEWLIIGYSFPDEDMNIRSLFTRALGSRQRSPHVTAIQLRMNDATRNRYEAFFPRERLTYLPGGLGTFLNNLGN